MATQIVIELDDAGQVKLGGQGLENRVTTYGLLLIAYEMMLSNALKAADARVITAPPGLFVPRN